MSPDDLAKILDELGKRLGPTGQHVFELAVRNVVITNTIWVGFWGVVAVISLATLLVSLYKFRSYGRLLASLSDRIDADVEDRRAINNKMGEYERAKQAANLEAMTAKERAAWLNQASQTYGFGTRGYVTLSYPSLSEFDDANLRPLWVAIVSAVILLFAVGCLLIRLPGLLNPEYAALRDLLDAISR